jgi:hypothetical protein
MNKAGTAHERRPPLAAWVYVVLVGGPFIFAATHAWFWNGERPFAPVSALVFAIVLIALLSRHRWAWWVLVILNGVVVISYIWEWTNAISFVANLASLALLSSTAIRSYVGQD